MPRPSRWNELVAAAAAEFQERGYDRATVEGIAERCGILKGSVYHYVDSKEQLLFAVLDEPAAKLLDEMEVMADQGGSASDRLRSLFRAQVRIFSSYYPAAFVYLRQIGQETHPEAFRERDERYMGYLERILRDGVDRNEFSLPMSPRMAARAVVGILNWMQQWFVPNDGDPAGAEMADKLFAIAVGGLRNGSGALRDLQDSRATGVDPP